MKTLKKSLCLILALVFVLGLCTIGAGAAFTDADEIKYADAVGIMADLGILSGMGDGTFAPTANVTRAQAAKMIAYMILGKDNAERMPAVAGTFTDVNAGDWYAKYVGYCAKQGIINGMGDGTFRPDDAVTGTQLAKMILCAVGFGKGNEYVGDGWDFNAVADALTYGIYNGSEAADFADKATREECALYVFNALTAVKIQSYKDGAYADGAQTYGDKVWKLQNKTGIVMANKASGDKATQILLDGAAATTAFKYDTDLDVIGHEVRVLYKENADKTVASVYSITDVSTTIAKYAPVAASTKTAATVYKWANYQKTDDTAYVAATKGAANDNLIVYNDTVIGYTVPEVFNIGEVTAIDSKSVTIVVGGVANKVIDLKTMLDGENKAWTLVDASKGDYIEVIEVGSTYITRATSKFENIKITQITNATNYTKNSYNNGQFMQSGATNVASYLNEAAVKLTLGTSYTFYKDSKGNFFKADVYKAPDAKTSAVFFVKSFTIKGSDTYDEWGQTVGAQDAYYAQCVTAAGESVNYATKELYKGDRGPVSLSFDDKGNAILGTASDVEKIDGKDWSKTAVTKIPGQPWYLTSDANIIVLSEKKVGAKDESNNLIGANLGNLKVTTSTGSIKGDFSKSDVYVAIPNTTATAKDIQTIWIDGAAQVTEVEKPVANSYIYVNTTLTAPSGVGYAEDGKTEINNFNVYIDGAMTQIAVGEKVTSLSAGFYTYSIKGGVYTLTAIDTSVVEAVSVLLDGKKTLLYGGVFTASDKAFEGKDISGLAVCDLRLLAPGTPAVTDVAGLEKLTETVTLTVLMTSKGAFVGVIYVSDPAPV